MDARTKHNCVRILVQHHGHAPKACCIPFIHSLGHLFHLFVLSIVQCPRVFLLPLFLHHSCPSIVSPSFFLRWVVRCLVSLAACTRSPTAAPHTQHRKETHQKSNNTCSQVPLGSLIVSSLPCLTATSLPCPPPAQQVDSYPLLSYLATTRPACPILSAVHRGQAWRRYFCSFSIPFLRFGGLLSMFSQAVVCSRQHSLSVFSPPTSLSLQQVVALVESPPR